METINYCPNCGQHLSASVAENTQPTVIEVKQWILNPSYKLNQKVDVRYKRYRHGEVVPSVIKAISAGIQSVNPDSSKF